MLETLLMPILEFLGLSLQGGIFVLLLIGLIVYIAKE